MDNNQEESNKLYKVTCRGMTHRIGGGMAHGVSYVVTKDGAEEAYRIVRNALEYHKLGFSYERELAHIELLAEGVEYPGCGTKLYIEEREQNDKTGNT